MEKTSTNLKDGNFCKVIAGTHKGKAGYVQDINTRKPDTLPLPFCRKM